MEREFRLPDIGEGLTEAEIVRWLVPEGGRVEADQPVVEVETDKAVVEIPSPYAGTVLRHGGAEGETIAVGSVLVVIGDGSETAATAPPPPTETEVPEASPVASAPPIVGTLQEEAEVLGRRPEQAARSASDTVKALPIVRKLARDLGVDLSKVPGSGSDGRVTREDVLAAAEGPGEEPAAAVPPSPSPERPGAAPVQADSPEPVSPEPVSPVPVSPVPVSSKPVSPVPVSPEPVSPEPVSSEPV
ncbi:MAG: biotin/lipoyl-containing protein, partial [Acidimicrobiia bacterium]